MRRSGILLHPTSLPGKWGIGDLGEWAYRFVDFLVEGGQQLWQILPLGPPGYGYSPYQSYSSVAGNPLLISPQALLQRGWLSSADLEEIPRFPASSVDFDAVVPFRGKLLRKAARAFFQRDSDPLRSEFLDFRAQKESWLSSFAQFAALKKANSGVAWTEWRRGAEADAQEVLDQEFIQFEFFREWRSLKRYCNERGIKILGDIPIFVAHDSADVWANPELFDLDETGRPRTVAGVPPDYFSETGQYWGSPHYRWDVMERTGYAWWIERMRSALDLVDIVRLDHFRGFEQYWEISADCTSAVNGRWINGPGDRLFEALVGALGDLPVVVEDLGYITPEVHALRDRWGFPGMRVLQFAFSSHAPDDPYKPYNFVRDCVVYTGTHDNNTTRGWFREKKDARARAEREFALRYLNSNGREVHWDFIRVALSSVADTVILPIQDILGLGSEARMNRPATKENNWRWRMGEGQLRPELSSRLREMNRTYGRLPE